MVLAIAPWLVSVKAASTLLDLEDGDSRLEKNAACYWIKADGRMAVCASAEKSEFYEVFGLFSTWYPIARLKSIRFAQLF